MGLESVTPGGGSDARTKGNEYKNELDFIITLVVVNSHKFFSYTD